MSKDILAYSMEFTSFLIDSIDETGLSNIRDIVLFGSAARNAADKESDVDIFVNLVKDNDIERKIEKIKNDFYNTEMCRRWQLRGIDNEIKIIAGRLEKWKDLRISIIADGISLYSKYTSRTEGKQKKQKVIIFWDNVRPESKRVLLSKKLYGYNYKKSRYKGLLELTGSTKLGANCIITNLADSKKIIEIFKGLRVTAKTIYVESLL